MDGQDDVVAPLRSDEAERIALELLVLDELDDSDGADLRGLVPRGCVSLSVRRSMVGSASSRPPAGDSA
jgi:hypothetical protein